MSAAVATVPIPTGWVLAELLKRLGATKRQDRSESAERDVFAEQSYEVTRGAWDAPNVQSLRQCFGEIGLSPEFAALELSLRAEASRVPALAPKGPLRAPARVVARLGKPTADLLTEVLELTFAILRAANELSVDIAPPEGLPPSAQEIARLRHTIVLGDLVPPNIAQVVLANFRGQAAFVFLLGALGVRDRLADWRGVAAGEIALEGMRAFQRLVLPSAEHIDLDAAVRQYETFKAEAFEKLSEAPDDSE